MADGTPEGGFGLYAFRTCVNRAGSLFGVPCPAQHQAPSSEAGLEFALIGANYDDPLPRGYVVAGFFPEARQLRAGRSISEFLGGDVDGGPAAQVRRISLGLTRTRHIATWPVDPSIGATLWRLTTSLWRLHR
jgi:hypothetical protein